MTTNKRRTSAACYDPGNFETYWEPLRHYLLARPPGIPCQVKKGHVALGEVRSMMGVKHERTRAAMGSDDTLTRCEQCTMLPLHTHATSSIIIIFLDEEMCALVND
jgi:hypothetical protein